MARKPQNIAKDVVGDHHDHSLSVFLQPKIGAVRTIGRREAGERKVFPSTRRPSWLWTALMACTVRSFGEALCGNWPCDDEGLLAQGVKSQCSGRSNILLPVD